MRRPGSPRSWPRRYVVAVVGLVLAVVLALTLRQCLRQNLMNCPTWDLVFDGYGTARCQGPTVLLSPAPSTVASETHAALATSRLVSVKEGSRTAFHAKASTRQQLRQNSDPNPWEVAWILWSYQDNNHFYALVLKPNGWEISKQNTAYPGAQQFLASGSEVSFPVGSVHSVDLEIDTSVAGAMTVTVTIDGTELVTVTDKDNPYVSGAVAAYTEDAAVMVALTPASG